MISLNDPRWTEIAGGYGTPINPSEILSQMERGENVWDELWNELHHQGDVGIASYAIVPHLVRIAKTADRRDWNFYGLVSMIEIERHRSKNPRLPDWVGAGYLDAWRDILALAIGDLATEADPSTVQSLLAAVALAKGDRELGAFIAFSDRSEIAEYLEQHLAWSEVYERTS